MYKNKRIKLAASSAPNLEDQQVASQDDDQSEQLKRKPPLSKNQQQDENKAAHNDGNNNNLDILSFNDDCLFAILEKLSLDDLSAMSQTCQHFHSLCANYFQRRHKERVLIFEDSNAQGGFTLAPDEKYVKTFAKYNRNVTLGKGCATQIAMKRLAAFYKSHEIVKKERNRKVIEKIAMIKELRIEGWSSGFRKTFGPIIADVLEDVESLTISNSKVDDLKECILKFAPDVKELMLCKSFNEAEDADWMEQNYDKLERFAWHLPQELPIDKFKQFLSVNPITFFSLLSKSQDTITQLIAEKIKVDELFFDGITTTNMVAVLDKLKTLCEDHQLCKRLHLRFDNPVRKMLDENLDKLISLATYIEGLYLEKYVIQKKLAQTLATFDNLKVLQCNIGTNATRLANIPNLETIYVFWGVNGTNFDKYEEAMMTYARHSSTLKKIFMRNNSQPFTQFNFEQLNSERCKLRDAPKLKIYFKSDESTYTGELNDIDRNYDMVEVERVESENIKNPLVNEWLIWKKIATSRYGRGSRRRW